MTKNIKIEYKNGVANQYVTQKTEDLYIPSLGFDTEEEAGKWLESHGMKEIINK